MRSPTASQADRLRPLADGYAVLAPKRGEYVGLLRAGWVERIDASSPRGGLLPPLRITEAGRAALALSVPGESECSFTISTLPNLSPVGSGRPLPRLRSLDFGSRLPRRAWKRPRCSSVSVSPLTPVRTGRVPHVLEDELADHVENLWRGLYERAAARDHRGGYAAGHRCWSCRLFVSGPTVTCPHCGHVHGGIHHQAYAVR